MGEAAYREDIAHLAPVRLPAQGSITEEMQYLFGKVL